MSDVMQVEDINLGGMVRQRDRRNARFEIVPQPDAVASRAAGRPIYRPATVLFVRHPGERDETTVIAQEHHQYEFPQAWAAFQAGQKSDATGTPLSILFPDGAHIVTHMRNLHIFTVEQLADVGEAGAGRIGMGARDYISRAQKFLEASEKAAPMHQMNDALRQANDQIALLQEQVAMLAQKAVADAEAPRRGRPRRQEMTDDGEGE